MRSVAGLRCPAFRTLAQGSAPTRDDSSNHKRNEERLIRGADLPIVRRSTKEIVDRQQAESYSEPCRPASSTPARGNHGPKEWDEYAVVGDVLQNQGQAEGGGHQSNGQSVPP